MSSGGGSFAVSLAVSVGFFFFEVGVMNESSSFVGFAQLERAYLRLTLGDACKKG